MGLERSVAPASLQRVARERSNAPSRHKGGALGRVRLEEAIRPYGPAFLERVCYDESGAPVTEGYRTGAFQSEVGFHIVWIVGVETAEPGDPRRRAQVADLLLDGTDWK